MKKKINLLKMFEDKENLVIFFILIGIVLLSLGVYLTGTHNPFGSTILTTGSGIFYISIIIFVFLFA